MTKVISVVEKPHKINPMTAMMIRRSGRSWWQCRYSDGRVVSEWDTLTGKLLLLPIGSSKTSRWEEIPKKGMIGLRLLCPNGMCGELEAPEGHKFFQLKVGGTSVTMIVGQGQFSSTTSHFQDAHIIGVVTSIDGDCFCRAWETTIEVIERGKTTETIPVGSNILVDSNKKWTRNYFLRRGARLHVFGQNAAIWGNSDNTIKIIGKWTGIIKGSPSAIPNNTDYLITAPQKRLIQFEDNIYNMKYRNIGRLNLEVQQLKV